MSTRSTGGRYGGVVDSPDRPADNRIIESIEHSFGTLFRFVKATITASAAKLDPALQPMAWSVLRILVREHPVPLGALASAMGLDKSVISRQIKDLRERGFVETEPSAEDARVVLVRPTALGAERVASIGDEGKERYTEFLGTWTEDELAEFARLLERFSRIADWPTDDDATR